METDKFRVALFGGSFDPPTKAHLHVAEQLIEQGVVDSVEFLPAYVSYHGKEYSASGKHRIKMLDKLIESSKYGSQMAVNNFEIYNKMQTSTYDFADKFLSMVGESDYNYCRHGIDTSDGVEYYFVVGGDNAKYLPNFSKGPNGECVTDRIPFIVVNRGLHGADDVKWCKKEPHIVVDIGLEHGSCSSSKIRDALHFMSLDGLCPEFLNDWCALDVFAYILSNELYDVGGNDENS